MACPWGYLTARFSTAVFSPRKDLVKNYRVRPAHWLIYAQVAIGTMTLTVTFYTLAVENLNIKSAKDVQDKAKELQAKAKAAAETAKGNLTGRGKKKAFFGDEDDDDDGAAAQVAQDVTPHGDEDRREWGRTSDGKMGWVPPRPAPAPTRLGPVVREMPLQQEAPVDVEAPAIHKKRHHKKTVTSPTDGDEEAPPPPPDDDAVPPPPPDEEDEEAPAKSQEELEAAVRATPKFGEQAERPPIIRMNKPPKVSRFRGYGPRDARGSVLRMLGVGFRV